MFFIMLGQGTLANLGHNELFTTRTVGNPHRTKVVNNKVEG
jgi:hypothetical protein